MYSGQKLIGQKMAKESVGRVVTFNCISIVIVLGTSLLCGMYLDWPNWNVVRSPLQSTVNITCVMAVWNTLGLYLAQQAYRISWSNLCIGCVVNCLFVLLFHVALIAFGAPLTKTVSETFHLAVLLTVLIALPSTGVLGINTSAWGRLFLLNSADSAVESSVWWVAVGTVLGVWLGAVPIPLDWDRPWQVWPISCVIGCLTGHVLGLVCGTLDILVRTVQMKIKRV